MPMSPLSESWIHLLSPILFFLPGIRLGQRSEVHCAIYVASHRQLHGSAGCD